MLNIYLNDLFIFLEEAKDCSYADDTTIYQCDAKIKTIIVHLGHYALKITEWVPKSFMQLNEDKFHLMIFGVKGDNEITIEIGEACVKENTEENLLSITFD